MTQPARGRGRPPTGEPVLVRLTPEQRAVAERLGEGNLNAGVRLALDLAGKPHRGKVSASGPAVEKSQTRHRGKA